jgi:23S rRNA pseudouridine955/2504/2580 synthase
VNRQNLNALPARKVPSTLRTITADEAGQRIDNFLMRHFKTVPRSRVYRLLRKGEVRVNRKRVDAEYRIRRATRCGCRRCAWIDDPDGGAGPALEQPARAHRGRVIFQDKHLLVLDKPAGVAVHGGSGMSFGVIEALRASRPRETLELVHRLDRDTSGCLLIARDRHLDRAARLIRNGGMHKTYMALVCRQLAAGHQAHRCAARDRQSAARRAACPSGAGRQGLGQRVQAGAVLRPLATLMEVDIPTGRTHQIRVHASFAGHPLLGDDKYGDRTSAMPSSSSTACGGPSCMPNRWPSNGRDPACLSMSARRLPAELAAVIDAITP